MMRCLKQRSAASTALWQSIRSSTRARALASPTSATRNDGKCRPYRRWSFAPSPNGCKSLYLASHAGRIFGMSEHDGRALIDEFVAHATQRQFVYTHRWRAHALVPAQPVDATQVLNLSAGVSNAKVFRGRSFS